MLLSFVALIGAFAFLGVLSWLDVGRLFLFFPLPFLVGICSLIKFVKVP